LGNDEFIFVRADAVMASLIPHKSYPQLLPRR